MKKTRWYKLDNIGKFYSFTNNSKLPAVFRYSVTLTERVEKKFLQEALDETLRDFPNFHVHLKRGFFWYYLETSTNEVIVEEEHREICAKLYRDSLDVLFRVNYYRNRINFEVSHILSDGRGSLKFFEALITRYLIKKYNLKDIYIEDDASSNEKSEDSFDKHYTKNVKSDKKKEKIYLYKGKKRKHITFMEYHVSSKKMLDLAHSYNASLTSLLIAILIYSYMNEMKEIEISKTIKINVPVDLRGFFNSKTSRNFFGLTSVSYTFKSKDEDFKNVVTEINSQLKSSVTLENLRNRMNKMMSFEKNVFARIIPVFIKDLGLRIIDKFTSGKATSNLSNIGAIKMDERLNDYIINFNVLNTADTLKMVICSFKDDLSIGISTKYESNDIVKTFIKFLSDNDITGVLNTNWSDEDEEM